MLVNNGKLAGHLWKRGGWFGCVWLALAGTVVMCSDARGQWAGDSTPQLLVDFEIVMVPDDAAQSAGAVTVTNRAWMEGGLWLDTRFTGGGCVLGAFASSAVSFGPGLDGGRIHPFEVRCKSRSIEDKESLIEWKGELREGKLTGDVWITFAGTAMTAKQVAARREAARVEARRSVPKPVIIEGQVVNKAMIESRLREVDERADERSALISAEGRRIHFTFTTKEVVIHPVGSWNREKGPATRPSSVERGGLP